MISQTISRQGRTKGTQVALPLFLDDPLSDDETPEQIESPQEQRAGNSATLGFEERLWAAADTLRGHIDAAEYKHIVLGLVFLKYLADLFEERARCLRKVGQDPESREAYAAKNVAWLPPVHALVADRRSR